MAKAGNFAAYQQSQPIAEDFGDNMLQAENQQFKYRQEERYKQQQEAARQKAIDDDIQDAYDKFVPVAVGNKTADEALMQYYSEGMRAIGDAGRQLKNPNISARDKQVLQHRINMLNKAPEVIKAYSGVLTNYTKTTVEGINKGEISGWDQMYLDEAEAQLDLSGGKGFTTVVGPDGLPVNIGVTANGEKFRVPLLEGVNGLRYQGNTARVDMQDWTKKTLEIIGPNQEGAWEKGLVGTKQTFESIKEDARELIATELGTVEDPSDLAKSVWVDVLKKDPRKFNEESLKEIENHLLERAELGYGKKFSGSQARQNDGGDDTTGSERKLNELGESYYTQVNAAVLNDPEALQGLINVTKNIDGQSRTVAEVVTTESANILLDRNGDVIQEIPLNASQEERRGAFKRWFSKSNDPSEDQDMYNRGEKQAGGTLPEVQSQPSLYESKEVPVKPVENIDNMNFDTVIQTRDAINQAYPHEETGIKATGMKGGLFKDDYIILQADNGATSEKIYVDQAGAKQLVKNFIQKHAKKKTTYTKAEQKKQEQKAAASQSTPTFN